MFHLRAGGGATLFDGEAEFSLEGVTRGICKRVI